MADFELHPRLAADCTLLAQFPLCQLLLMEDANYPWFILVPQRAAISEIHELPEADRSQLLDESVRLSQALAAAFAADKLNIAALGNVVPQLHLHHVVRYRSDVAWPDPVWGRQPRRPYTQQERAARIARLRGALGDAVRWQSGAGG